MADIGFCTSCGRELPNEIRFCASCGQRNPQFVEDIFCKKCGSKITPNETYCPSCGTENPNSPEAIDRSKSSRVTSKKKLIFHALISLIGPIGIGLAIWYIFKKKNIKFGLILIAIAFAPGVATSVVTTSGLNEIGRDNLKNQIGASEQNEAASNIDFAIPTHEGKIAFLKEVVADSGIEKRIFVMNPDGSDIQQISDDKISVGFFDVSSDGKKIVFGEPNDIVLRYINVDGSEIEGDGPLYEPIMLAGDIYIFGPNGQEMVIPSHEKRRIVNVHWLTWDTDLLQVLVELEVVNTRTGRREAHIIEVFGTPMGSPGQGASYSISGYFSWIPSKNHFIERSNNGEANIDVLNDGGIIFLGQTGRVSKSDIYVGGWGNRIHSEHDEEDLSISPDETKIAFSDVRLADSTKGIYSVDIDGQNEGLLASGIFYGEPQWSPSGRYITYRGRDEKTKRMQIFVMSSDGSNQTQLTFTGGSSYSPIWVAP